MEPSIFEFFLAVVVIVPVAGLIICFFVKDVRNKFAEINETEARLTAKQQEEEVSQPVFKGGGSTVREGYVEKRIVCTLLFEELESQNQHTFEVEERVYNLVNEQDEGMLVYKGDKLIAFKNIKTGLPPERRSITFRFLNNREKRL